MKLLRKLTALAVLSLTFSASSAAGEIHTGTPAPPPTPPQAQGQVSTPAGTTDESASYALLLEALTETRARLFGTLLSLF
jgi:hypothetical protein